MGDPLEAEELTQESFVRAFRALSGFAGERRFYPWLSVIAARLCVDNHRRKARTEPSAEIDTGITDGGQDRIIDAVDIDLLNQALARLGPRHREVLRLREEEGWSYQHIASHYDVSLGTVEALLWRARRALRREFIAVAGPEATGAAAGIPLLGWLVRRMHGLRMRVAQWTDAGHARHRQRRHLHGRRHRLLGRHDRPRARPAAGQRPGAAIAGGNRRPCRRTAPVTRHRATARTCTAATAAGRPMPPVAAVGPTPGRSRRSVTPDTATGEGPRSINVEERQLWKSPWVPIRTSLCRTL